MEKIRGSARSSIAVRTTGRAKKAKSIFDPSYVPRAHRKQQANKNASKEESLSAIRQIIGYDVNLQPMASPKPEQPPKRPRQEKKEKSPDNNASFQSSEMSSSASSASENDNDNLPKCEFVRLWSKEKLTEYMGKYFPNEAHVFKENEIDGETLMEITREDIMGKLSLKLGPAVRLYKFITKLQNAK